VEANKILPKSDFALTYELTGAGWSECRITHGAMNVMVTASYLGDALGDLASATVNLLEAHATARCSFDEEPGEFRWVFEVVSGNLHVRVLEFPELWSNAPDEQGNEIFCSTCTVREFAEAVHKAMQVVLAKHGLKGYKSNWVQHDFPLKAFQQIESKLSTLGAET
jgi:hypothetical protein